MPYDLIIIGADAAGLSAGIYAGRKKLNAVILTKQIGGQSLYTDNIENYPGFLSIPGAELISKLKAQVGKFKVPIEEGEEVLEVRPSPFTKGRGRTSFILKTKSKEYQAKSVIIASGSNWESLNIPGEKEFMGKGVSVCAICDAPFYQGKNVAVIGGGNTAFESAYDLLKYANKIYLLQHRDKFIGDEALYKKLEDSGKVEFLTNAETREIKGKKFAEGLVYEDLRTGDTKELKVGGIFVNIGQIPNSEFAEKLVDLNEKKEIIIDPKTNAASVAGIFAAGDVTDGKYKQAVIAASEGAKAALSATLFLSTL